MSRAEKIVVKRITEADGSSGWVWDTYDQDSRIGGGAAPNLARALGSMNCEQASLEVGDRVCLTDAAVAARVAGYRRHLRAGTVVVPARNYPPGCHTVRLVWDGTSSRYTYACSLLRRLKP